MTNRTLQAIIAVCAFTTGRGSGNTRRMQGFGRENYPSVKQYRLIELSRDYTVDNASKAWLPKISVAAGAILMSDITGTWLEARPEK